MDENVLYFKLVTGEDIVAITDTISDEYIYIHKPIQFFVQNSAHGAVVRVAKWIPFSSAEDFALNTKDIMLSFSPTKDIEDYYFEAISTLDKKYRPPKLNTTHDYFSNTSFTVH